MKILKKLDLDITGMSINSDGNVDVNGDVILRSVNLGNQYELPFKFGTVNGNFVASLTQLKTFKNCPDHVTGDFKFEMCLPDSLIGCTKRVDGSFGIWGVEIKSLEGAPEYIGKEFYLGKCDALRNFMKCGIKTCGGVYLESCANIESLRGFPKIVNGNVFINTCEKIKSIVGLPKIVNGDFELSCNKIPNLIGMPRTINGDLYIRCESELRSLQGCEGTHVHGNMKLIYCTSLRDLKYLPKVDGDIVITRCNLDCEMPEGFILTEDGLTWVRKS